MGASMNRANIHITNDRYRPDVMLSHSLDSPSIANTQYYQRFENFAADSRRHGQSRNAEMARLALYSQRQQANLVEQREVLESLQQSYQFSHMQHEELCSRFQELMTNSHLLMNTVREKAGAVTSQHRQSISLADDSDRVMNTPQVTRVPIITLPLERTTIPSMRMSMNWAPSSAGSHSYSPRQGPIVPMRRSFDQSPTLPRQVTEQEYIARMQMYFQERILYAHELAQQERQRSNELMSQMLALKMQQDRMHFFDTEHELDDRMAWTESAQEVSVESLIDEYAGAHYSKDVWDSSAPTIERTSLAPFVEASLYEMQLRGMSAIIKTEDMDDIMRKVVETDKKQRGFQEDEPLDETHTWQHVTSLPLSQQVSATNSNSSVQLDAVTASVEEDLAMSAKVTQIGLHRASIRSNTASREIADSSSSDDEPTTQSDTASSANPSRTASITNRITPVEHDGPPSMWGGGPVFPR